MPKDYKHRANTTRNKKTGIPAWRWIAVILLLTAFGFFLSLLGSSEPKVSTTDQPIPARAKKPMAKNASAPEPDVKPANTSATKQEKQFQFYFLLPEDEVEIPATEIKSLKQEEKLGKAKQGHYELQAGSFREIKQANRLKIELAMLGIPAKIETANIGSTLWNRVKLGPYSSMNKADSMRKRLRNNNIDTVIISKSPH